MKVFLSRCERFQAKEAAMKEDMRLQR